MIRFIIKHICHSINNSNNKNIIKSYLNKENKVAIATINKLN